MVVYEEKVRKLNVHPAWRRQLGAFKCNPLVVLWVNCFPSTDFWSFRLLLWSLLKEKKWALARVLGWFVGIYSSESSTFLRHKQLYGMWRGTTLCGEILGNAPRQFGRKLLHAYFHQQGTIDLCFIEKISIQNLVCFQNLAQSQNLKVVGFTFWQFLRISLWLMKQVIIQKQTVI